MLHLTVATAQKTIDAVMKQFDPDPNKQNLIAAIRMGIALHGAEQIEKWREQTDDYPQELVRATVQRYAQIDHFWRIEMWRERGDLAGLYGNIVQIQGVMMHVLMAVNRMYFFGIKHRETIINALTIVPTDLHRRMNACFVPEPHGEEILRRLVEELCDLIEIHVPGVDVARLRSIFRYRRPLWDVAHAGNLK
jgi:hypothetical protein